MEIKKRIINEVERDVQCYDSEQEYKDSEKDRRNMEHADRIYEGLAKDKGFIKSLAKEIAYQLIEYNKEE